MLAVVWSSVLGIVIDFATVATVDFAAVAMFDFATVVMTDFATVEAIVAVELGVAAGVDLAADL